MDPERRTPGTANSALGPARRSTRHFHVTGTYSFFARNPGDLHVADDDGPDDKAPRSSPNRKTNMSRRTADTPPARPPRAPIPDISRPDPATQETTPEHTDTLHADPARFFKPSYTQELRNLIGRIAEHHAPLLLSELADQVAHAHGWPHADGRIKDRVQRNLRQVEVHLEYGSKLFVWPQGQYADRAPFKGGPERAPRRRDLPDGDRLGRRRTQERPHARRRSPHRPLASARNGATRQKHPQLSRSVHTVGEIDPPAARTGQPDPAKPTQAMNETSPVT